MTRARELGIPFPGMPGAHNAITDVGDVAVGHATIVRPKQRVYTGVTVIWPRGRDRIGPPAFAGRFALNGNGEMTGTAWIDEANSLEGVIALTNTYSVGTVHEAVLRYHVAHGLAKSDYASLPVVGETWDGAISDIKGFHVTRAHVVAALTGAKRGPVAEGNVGGGTGMITCGFKGGIGTASRRVGRYTVGALVQSNWGKREQLVIAGVPIGREMPVKKPKRRTKGSILVVLATDAPVWPKHLERLARRATHGLARCGSISEDSSGDLFIAFGTRNAPSRFPVPANIDELFGAAAEATEEAIVNALVAADDLGGIPAIDRAALAKRFA